VGAVSETRERIADHVQRSPGVHFRGLVRALDLAPGQVQYHLRRLRRDDRVVREEVGGRTHFFDPGVDPAERRQIALLRRETARDVVALLADRGPQSPARLADQLGIARSTLEFHVERLIDAGLVGKSYDARGRVTLSLADPAAVGHLLDALQPSLPERLTDRFTRLVDSLLAE
jgi:predicted transcriptional regulator